MLQIKNEVHPLEGLILVCVLWISMAVLVQFIAPTTAYAEQHVTWQAQGTARQSLAAKLDSSAPTSDSRLLVLLDRSGSLLTTDSQGYSVSLARAISHIWPGMITFLLISGDGSLIPILGSYRLSDPRQRARVEAQLENLPPVSGDTPIAPALQEALALLQKQGIPAGSRAILITDGGATGLGNNDTFHQEQKIREQLIPELSKLGVPISTYDLISNTPEGQDANQLLSDIANGTHGIFDQVTNVSSLARAVVFLIAQWRNMALAEVPEKQGNFTIPLNEFTTEVAVAAFRTDGQDLITFQNPLKFAVIADSLLDKHFELGIWQPHTLIHPGYYTLEIKGDKSAQERLSNGKLSSTFSGGVQLNGCSLVHITIQAIYENTYIETGKDSSLFSKRATIPPMNPIIPITTIVILASIVCVGFRYGRISIFSAVENNEQKPLRAITQGEREFGSTSHKHSQNR